ncbi:MAG: type IIL restriction-modification enzyme MmeI [Opitutaceae bacterium]
MPPSSTPAVLTLSREEMRARALAFSKRWHGPQREEAEAKSFLDDFFDVFGRDRHAVDAVHEYRVERGEGRIDLLWPGKLLVKMKSTSPIRLERR